MKWCRVVIVLIVGQAFSILAAASGIFTKELVDAHLNTPIFNSVLAYFLMMLFFLSPKSRNTPNSKWTYFISSIFDVVALNTSIQAFQRTLIASVTMITVLSVITTTIMSIIWFKMRYFWTHYLAILFCIGGVFLTLYSDFFTPDGFDFGSFWGDILAVISALCYGVTSVISEYLVRSGSNNIAILAHLGFFGFVFALIASFAFTEFRELSHFQEQTDPHYADLWWYAAYAFAGAGIYFFAQLTIYLSSATIFHLIGLTSTLWGMLGDVLVFDKDFKLLYVLGYALIIAGVILFYCRKPIDPLNQGQSLLKLEDHQGGNKDNKSIQSANEGDDPANYAGKLSI